MTRLKGQLIKIKFKDLDSISGLIVDYSNDWILMRQIPVDYVVDGYVIVRNKNWKQIVQGDNEKWVEKIVKMKLKRSGKAPLIPLQSLASILKYLTNKYGLFELHTKSKNALWLGRLKSINNQSLVIEWMNAKAKWDGEMKFREREIRAVKFDTDYVNSLLLVG
jgi:hypothetical protein